MDAHAILIARIDELASKHGYSINRLADAAGISRGYLSSVLRGKFSPSVKTLEKLALALNVPAYELLRPARPAVPSAPR